MEEDISNKTIVVLVLLTVIISILSTLVVLNEVVSLQPAPEAEHQTSTQGRVSLTITPTPQVADSATGRVSLGIEPREVDN